MGDNPLEVEHLWLKGLEPEMKGSTLESLRFHQLQELASQGQQVPDESTRYGESLDIMLCHLVILFLMQCFVINSFYILPYHC